MDDVAAITELAGVYRSTTLCSPFRFRTGVRPVSGRGEDCARIDCLVCTSVFADDPRRHLWGHPPAHNVRVMGHIQPQIAESGATCSLLRVDTARRSVGSQFASENRISGLNGDFDWNRTRIDGTSRVRA